MRAQRSTVRVLVVAATAVVAAVTSFSTAAAGARTTDQSWSGSVEATTLRWYDITDRTVTAAAFPEALTQSRTWAVSWLAASRAVGHRHDPRFTVPAFTQALHDTLVDQVPSERGHLDADLADSLAGVPEGRTKRAGISTGHRQAAELLAARRGDGTDASSLDVPYSPPAAAPGVWQPTPPTFEPAIRANQGNARSFLLARNDQFDPGPPPSLSSRVYRRSLAEVHAYGSAQSSVRTPEQTRVAQFWFPALNFAYVQVLRSVLAHRDYSLSWATGFVGAFHAVTSDAQIAVYNTKFKYVFWRPVTAIRTGDVDRDPTWTPQSVTPRYPEYASGHGSYAGAAERVLDAFVGRRAPTPVALTSPNAPGVTRTYTDWATITRDVVDARVWEGVHYRFSDVIGVREGAQVANYGLSRLASRR